MSYLKNSVKTLLLLLAFVTAKADKIDSLKAILKNAPSDAQYFEVCIKLGVEYRTVGIDSSIKYHELALRKASKLSTLEELKAENELGYDRVKKKEVELGEALLKKVNKQLLSQLTGGNNLPKVYSILQWNYNYLGLTLRKMDSLYESLHCFEKAFDITNRTGDLQLQSDLCNNIAQTHYMVGSYTKSLEYCLKGIKINEKRKDKQGLASSTGNAGILFKELRDYKKALEYFESALKMNQELNNQKSIAVNLGNIGVAYDHLGDKELALKYYTQSAELDQKIGNKEGLIYNFNNIAILLSEEKQYDKAVSYHEKALEITKELDDNYAMAHTFIYLGTCYVDKGNNSKAQEYLDKGFGMCSKLNAIDLIQEYYDVQSKLYANTGQYQKSLEAYKNFILYRDSVNNEDNLRKSIQLETNHRFEKKLSEDSVLHANEQRISNAELNRKNAELKADRNLQYGLYAFLGLALVSIGFVYNRFKITNKQKNVIHKQKEMAEWQKQLLEEKQKEILDSINYAKRIQFTLLAHEDVLNKHLPDHFVLFRPKDVVSGDFYWSAVLNDGLFVLATADSTGHGVPGAIMSLLNITSLEKAIESYTKPSEILNETRKIIIERLKRDGSEEGGKDGMDCSLCVFDFKKMKLIVASAHNPVWIVRGEEVIEIKGDKMPVGKHDNQNVPFTQHEVLLQKGDMIYTLTDGYFDQFGGNKGKKFMSKNLRLLLARNAHLPTSEQRQILETTFVEWSGDHEQVDDVCIIGIRL